MLLKSSKLNCYLTISRYADDNILFISFFNNEFFPPWPLIPDKVYRSKNQNLSRATV